MDKVILYTGESSLALFELGMDILGSTEKLADDDVKILISPEDIVDMGNGNLFNILRLESVEFE